MLSTAACRTAKASSRPRKSFELIARHLQAGDEVEVGGFGKFTLSDHAARQGRNPSTGETIQIPASRAAKFCASSAPKNAVKG